MQKKQYLLSSVLLSMALCSGASATARKSPPLTDSILKTIDGMPGVFDAKKVENTLWMIKEIKQIHSGIIKLNSRGESDPRNGKATKLRFNGKDQTIKSLIALEKNAASLTEQDRRELNALFALVKHYFGAVKNLLMVEARGTQQFMIKLINEFCRKNNRSNSLLLKWDDEGGEDEMYRHDIVNFSIFYVFSTDLINFLAALIVSCPKAKAAYARAHKKS